MVRRTILNLTYAPQMSLLVLLLLRHNSNNGCHDKRARRSPNLSTVHPLRDGRRIKQILYLKLLLPKPLLQPALLRIHRTKLIENAMVRAPHQHRKD